MELHENDESSNVPVNAELIEAIFSEYIGQRAPTDQGDFEAWLAGQRPAERPHLRELYEDLRVVGYGDAAFMRKESAALAPSAEHPGADDVHDKEREPGSPFGGFRLVRRLGRGGMGEVWEAWQLPLKRRVALKLLNPELASSERARARFLREAEAGARLRHEGIVAVFDYGEVAGTPYIAQELVEGGYSLAHQIKERQMSKSVASDVYLRVGRLFVQVARALAAAHEGAVVHRDVTPSNILIDPSGRARVADFGLACVVGVPNISTSGDFSGTLEYLSPEQAMARRIGIDHRTDIFSLGVTLYEALTLKRPFTGDSMAQVVEKIMYEEPPDPRTIRSQVPRDLAVICAKAMEKERRRRYPTMQAMADDLQCYVEQQPIRARPRGPVRRALVWGRQNRLALAVTVGLFALGLGTLLLERQRVERARAEQMADFARLRQWRERYERSCLVDPGSGGELRALLADAQALALRRSVHERRLLDLRERALPRSPGDEELDRASSSDHDRLRFEQALERARLAEGAQQRAAEDAEADAASATVGSIIAQFADPVTLGAHVAAPSNEFLALEERVRARKTWRFESEELQWEHDATREFLRALDELLTDDGSVARVSAFAGLALDVERRSVTGPDALLAWQRALRDVADVDLYPHYCGLRLQPQHGLLPLDVDPCTKLWEFLYVASGDRPKRRADGEGWELGRSDGIVMVLLPGGRFRMGSAPENGGAVEPHGRAALDYPDEDEGPSHEVDLAPFFISKYELTQGQYSKWMRSGAARSKSGFARGDRSQDGGVHPLEQISWYESMQLVQSMGLCLPTEAQWEYAARGGSTGKWWCGEERSSLITAGGGRINLADRAAAASGARWPTLLVWPEYEDGFKVHARVDALEPNGFGLYHTAGNVAEWCLDRYASYAEYPYVLPDSGERLRPDVERRVVRGGSFMTGPNECRSSHRHMEAPEYSRADLGLRPVRAIR